MDQIASVLQIAVGIAVLPVANVVDQSASVLQIAVLLVANVVDQSASVLQNAVLLLANVAHKPTEIEHFKPVTKCCILFIAFIIYHCMLCSVVCIVHSIIFLPGFVQNPLLDHCNFEASKFFTCRNHLKTRACNFRELLVFLPLTHHETLWPIIIIETE